MGCGGHLDVLPLPSTSLLVSPRKELIHLSGAPIFLTATQETPPALLALVASKAYTCGPPRRYIYLAYLKKLMPEGLACSQLESRCWDPPSATLTDLAHPKLLGTIKKIIGWLDKQDGLNKELGEGWTIRFISYTRPLLQDCERLLFHLLHRNQHRE